MPQDRRQPKTSENKMHFERVLEGDWILQKWTQGLGHAMVGPLPLRHEVLGSPSSGVQRKEGRLGVRALQSGKVTG